MYTEGVQVSSIQSAAWSTFTVRCGGAWRVPAWKEIAEAGEGTLVDCHGEAFEVVSAVADGDDIVLTVHDIRGPTLGSIVTLIPRLRASEWSHLQSLVLLAEAEVQGVLWRDEDEVARVRFHRACQEVLRVAKISEAQSVLLEARAQGANRG